MDAIKFLYGIETIRNTNSEIFFSYLQLKTVKERVDFVENWMNEHPAEVDHTINGEPK